MRHARMILEAILLSGRSQTLKTMYHVIPHIRNVQKGKTHRDGKCAGGCWWPLGPGEFEEQWGAELGGRKPWAGAKAVFYRAARL